MPTLDTVKRPRISEEMQRPSRTQQLRAEVELAERFRGMPSGSLRRRIARSVHRTA